MYGYSKRTNESVPLLVGSWACRAACSALVALVGPVQNIFSLALAYFSSFVPIAHQAGQAAVLGRMSLRVVSAQDKPTISVCALMISSFDFLIGEKIEKKYLLLYYLHILQYFLYALKRHF